MQNAGEGVTQVFVESEGDSYVVATLSAAHPQFSTEIALTDQDVTLSVKGKGEVHVTGTFAIDSMMDESGDEMDDSDLMAEYPSDSDEEEGLDHAHPAHTGNRVQLLPEDGGSDSSDSSAEKKVQAAASKAGKQGGKPAQAQGGKPQQQQGGAKPQPQQQGGKPQQQGGKPQQQQGGKPAAPQQAGKPQQQQGGAKPAGQGKPIQQGKPAGGAPAANANAFQAAGGKKKKRKNKGGAEGQASGEKKAKN